MPDDGPADAAPIEREAYDWMRHFASGAARPDDLAALRLWSARSPLHRQAFDRVSRTWQALGPVGEARRALDSLAGFKADTPRPHRIGRRAFLGGALAASAAGAAVLVARPPLGLWPSWSELAADYRTEPGEQRQVALAGDVSVELNTRTSIAIRPGGAQAGGIELIAGEAMVQARSGTAGAVTVVAADGRIVAADARFNVRYDQGRTVYVTCLEGEVRVERLAAALPLPAGRQVIYSEGGLGSSVAIDPAAVTAWQQGLVIFRSTPVAEVVAEVNRYRAGQVILTNAALGRRQLNARFRIEDIDRVVGQIEQVFGAHATTLPGGIVLLG